MTLDTHAKAMLASLITEYDREAAYLKEAESHGEHDHYTSHIDGRMAGIRTAIALLTGVYDIPTGDGGVRAWLPGLRRLAR